MSTTLTNGLKLPDKGSVDWYADMQNNYQILDGAVGTIAGKAPLVHTHTKSDITDFPAYGTTAGTICEGNDSRLSDARTPVAHTHGKADITDLFNSANVWTNAQTYSADSYGDKIKLKNTGLDLSVNGNTGLSSAYQHLISWVDKNETAYSLVQSWTSNSENVLVLRSRYRTNANTVKDLSVRFASTATNKVVYPESNGDTDLGTSTKQWNNLYAKNYYYNGVAWGLDKANVWTGTNTFQQNITYERTNLSHNAVNPCYILKDTGVEKGTLTTTHHVAYPGLWHDKNSAVLGYMRFVEYDTGKQTAEIRVSNLIKNGALDPTGSIVNCTVNLVLQPSGEKSLIPEQNNDINLGTSTNKWKTLNGINPGALSLPDVATTWEDITGYVLDGTTENRFPISGVTALDGWLQCRVTHTLGTVSFLRMEMSYRVWIAQDKDCVEEYTLWVPVKAGASFNKVICLADDLKIRFHPCLGNV